MKSQTPQNHSKHSPFTHDPGNTELTSVAEVPKRNLHPNNITRYRFPSTQNTQAIPNVVKPSSEPVVSSTGSYLHKTTPFDVDRPFVPDNLRVSTPTQPPSFFSNPTQHSNQIPESSLPTIFSQLSYGESKFYGEINTNTFCASVSAISKDSHNEIDVDEDLPFFEELGVNPEHILQRMKSVLLFHKIDQDLLTDMDMCGPLFIAACLGFFSLLAGKIHFGYIYGLSVTGSIGLFILLNLMSQKNAISLYSTISILGYGLSPVVFLASLSVLFSLKSAFGAICSALCVLWCTATASRFFETALEMTHQRYLVAYPIFLLYGSFVLITVL